MNALKIMLCILRSPQRSSLLLAQEHSFLIPFAPPINNEFNSDLSVVARMRMKVSLALNDFIAAMRVEKDRLFIEVFIGKL